MNVKINPNRTELYYALVLLVVSLCLAWFLKWEANDIIWSMWLSSLCTGIAIIVASSVKSLSLAWRKHEPKAKLSQYKGGKKLLVAGLLLILLPFTLFPFIFTILHFTGFHIFHAMFLNALFPIFDTQAAPFIFSKGALANVYLPRLAEYALFTPVAFWMARKSILTPSKSLLAPYKNVIRMHLFIMLFGFLSLTGIGRFAVYALVYAVFVFPWQLLAKANVQKATAPVSKRSPKRMAD